MFDQIDPNNKPLRPIKTSSLHPEVDIDLSKADSAGLRDKWQSLNRNLRFGILSLVVLLLVGGGLLAYSLLRPDSQTEISIQKNKNMPETVASPLTGVQVKPELAERPVTAIMIENSPDSRPQSGIHEAGVVFEAIAEGGITRFLALFQEGQPSYVGPVRSLRTYYLDWAAPFDAAVAHVGGAPDALSQIRNSGKDLDQFFNPGSYWRQAGRAAPHNVYTSFQNLDELNKSKGFSGSKVQSWPRKADQPLATPFAKSIDINISSPRYSSHYDWDPASNTYSRKLAGQNHYSTSSPGDTPGSQLHPKSIVVLVLNFNISSDGLHSNYGTTGVGDVVIFQDGYVVKGRWYKPDRNTQYKFTDADGKEIKLNAGQTWVVTVQDPTRVSYQ